MAERFELFIAQKEFVNAYSELNDPALQLKAFEQQSAVLKTNRRRAFNSAQFARAGDEDTVSVDESFVDALRYGLPPTGGWGLGVDRLVTLLCDAGSIRVGVGGDED